ncbi:MAG: FAD-binding protein [Desulfarculus sp.]|nr:FAD-binding protein [Desulfarculus sp.]
MELAVLDAIAQAAGAENFSAGLPQRLLYASDAGKIGGEAPLPRGVARAVDTPQISRVLAVCHRHGVPVVPRGAGSGLTGGARAVGGGIVLDLAGLTRILSVNVADQVAVVEPGVVTSDLQAAAEAVGLFYPPDPASVGFSTIGGNVAENAGGLRAVKYGVTRDYVLGLKAVLMDGRVFRVGTRTIKSVVGYDLTRLLVGSEGTLAVITEITLRLIPKPEAKVTLSALYADLDQACQGVREVLASGIVPTACEFMDQGTLMAVENFAHLGLPREARAMLLIDLDGPPEVVPRQGAQLAGLLAASGGEPVRLAQTPREALDLWSARRAAGPAIYQLAPNKFNEDIVVPLGQLAEMLRRLERVGQERGIKIISFGHAGDGNLHVNIMHDASDPRELEAAHQAVSDIFAHVLALGGSLSGEHGVGTAKLGYVAAEMDPVALELMRGLKKIFDPRGLLNPGRLPPPG